MDSSITEEEDADSMTALLDAETTSEADVVDEVLEDSSTATPLEMVMPLITTLEEEEEDSTAEVDEEDIVDAAAVEEEEEVEEEAATVVDSAATAAVVVSAVGRKK